MSKAKVLPMLEEDTPYRPFGEHTEQIEKDFMKQATTPLHVAQVIRKACVSRQPAARYAVTFMAKSVVFATKFLPRRVLDAVVRSQFKVPGPSQVK
ncbi:MAG: hypothetical protein HC813_03090 [Planctomycetes bacterium]|nr:hypothetical protein [Planctomycetota bacterium]